MQSRPTTFTMADLEINMFSRIISLALPVEVSVDNGGRWHPTTGRETWYYEWLPALPGPVTLLSRAVDDSCNLENPTQGVRVSIE